MTPSDHNGAPASNKSTEHNGEGTTHMTHPDFKLLEIRIKALEDWVEKVKDQLI